MKRSAGVGCGIFLACLASVGVGQAADIRIVAYNTLNRPNDGVEDSWFTTVFGAIAEESVNGIAKRPDIVAVSETDTGSSARLVDVLNNLYGVSSYQVITSSYDGAGDRTGVVYDSSTLTLQGWSDLTEIGTHPIVRAQFRPVTQASPDSEFYVYAVHLKSGASASDKASRAVEAGNLRGNADALGEGKHIIYAGDFNMLGSSEGAWTNMVAAGNGQAFDAAESPGEWRDNEDFKSLHSQDSRGPMDDRFDLQFVSGECLDGQGFEYLLGSYHVFGNNGTHTLNGSISTGSGASPTVLAALEDASDHLPIVADYCIREPEYVPGDANRDGNVDFYDYLIVKANLGKTDRSWSDGDFDGDEDVDRDDFLALRSNFGLRGSTFGGLPPDGAAVPEPATVVLLVGAGLAALRGRRGCAGIH